MFCTQCGAGNADNAAVCVQCGRSLQGAAPGAALPVQGVPGQGVVLPPGVVVQNYLVFAILATIFCCLPAGIPAIVYAAQVNEKLRAGDLAGATAASNNAKLWCMISAGAFLGIAFIYGMVLLIGILLSVSHSN